MASRKGKSVYCSILWNVMHGGQKSVSRFCPQRRSILGRLLYKPIQASVTIILLSGFQLDLLSTIKLLMCLLSLSVSLLSMCVLV